MSKRSKATPDSGNPALPMTVPYDNRGLFADNYLKSRMSELADWREAPGLDDAFQAIKKLYGETREALAHSNEAQTEADFIRPILDLLWVADGRCWDVQVHIPALGERGKQPDYAFFCAAADRTAAGPHKGTQDYWRDVPCLGDAKGWNISLDKDRAGGENPSAKMSEYLYRSRVRWGILTNGQLWRLYEQDRSRAGGVFFQVDLQSILEHNDRAAFRWFYAFFRRDAFAPDTDGKTFVDKVFQGSVEYATEVGDRLKDSVYDALCALMNGFLDHASNHLDRHDEVTLQTVHDNTLILLYRLLFILYAEDRELLPLGNKHYQTYALVNTHREVNAKLRAGGRYPPPTTGLWARLLNLFYLIDEPDPACQIPAYNGGLFSPANHPHIAYTPQPDKARWDMGDDALAQAIDMLAYERERWDEPGSQDVDYKSLDVQHLGSIYEGLLELQPGVANEPMVETVENGKPVFKPESEAPTAGKVRGQTPRRVPKDAVYLVTNRGERKATGSYYTPKYIVDYIVDNTVGPLADEAAKRVAELRPEIDRRIAKLRKTDEEWETRGADEDTARLQVAKRKPLIDEERRKLLEPYLSLAILDPAMGSGHFLVGAADFLSLAMATDPKLLQLEANGAEDEQAYYKRLVVEHCLYGVDLNPLAVELAKLSLWLHTVSKAKALSFLDHHLRCGNSLIGASVDSDLTREPPQFNGKGKLVNGSSSQLVFGFSDALTATHLQSFLDIFKEISESTGGTAEIERHKADIYEKMDEVRDRFRAVANCWIAPYFGQPVSPKQYERAVNALKDPTERDKLEAEAWFQRSQQIATEKRLFHWELEFPDRFFDPNGLKADADRGFDAVVGNPPYVTVFPQADKKLFFERSVTRGRELDSFYLFAETGVGLLRPSGFLGLILPNVFMYQVEAEPFRRFLLQLRLVALRDYGFTVFGSATVPSAVLVLLRSACRPEDAVALWSVSNPETLVQQRCLLETPHLQFNPEMLAVSPLLAQVWRVAQPLARIAESHEGVHSGNIRGKLFSRTASAPYAKPMLKGTDINRYALAWGGEYVNYDPRCIERASGEYASLREERIFTSPKILTRQTGDSIIATWDASGFYTDNTLHCTLPLQPDGISPLYVLCLLNSRITSFIYQCMTHERGRQLAQVKIVFLRQLPIRCVDFTTPDHLRARLVGDFKAFYEQDAGADRMLAFVADQLSADAARTDVVHDILAFLAGEMIDLNKSKQEEVKGFLTWLEGYIGCAIEELTNKTKVKEYHKSDFDSLAAVLAQNSKKLSVLPDARATVETIQPEFEKSITKLDPLKARIAATDRLIDQIVYRLYGLTEDEIRIVEGACAS